MACLMWSRSGQTVSMAAGDVFKWLGTLPRLEQLLAVGLDGPRTVKEVRGVEFNIHTEKP